MDMPPSLTHEPLPDAPEGSTAQNDYRGRAFLYALLASGPEDLLKVGMTHDPLARWSAFHPRWFEVFDLDHSLLVETETRSDAQELETRLHRMLEAYSCPMPITMRGQAGGATEWYRGAYAAVRRFVSEQAALGFVVHASAMPWLKAAMHQQQERLEGLLRQAYADHMAGWLAPAQQRALQDLIDAHRCMDPEVPARLPTDILAALGIAI
ncbi:MAG: GIY-YIG nuclease family protein [Proteobacteria bacterium]|nr:GIY-YIG nuclease family protein [Pseudomonadota bacterium]